MPTYHKIGSQTLFNGVLNALQNGCVGDGVTDDSAAIQAVLAAAAAIGGTVYFPQGTYIANAITIPSNITIIARSATIKRKNASTGNIFLYSTGTSKIRINGLWIDGNKANQTHEAHNLSFDGCEDYQVTDCRIFNAKGSGNTYGAGIAISDGSNDTSVAQSIISKNSIFDNDVYGVIINKESYISVDKNMIKSNGYNGIIVINYVFPPVPNVENFLSITNNHCISNGSSGIGMVGFYTGGSPSAPILLGTTTPQKGVQITGNTCRLNSNYGIAFQGYGASILGNFCELNGTGTSGGGILVNAWGCSITANVVFDNTYWGIDMGGSLSCIAQGNTISYQGTTSGLGSVALNLGACVNCSAVGNVLENNGTSEGVAILASGYEYGGGYLEQRGSSITIEGNEIRFDTAGTHQGVVIENGFDRVKLKNNSVTGTAAGNAFILQGGESTYFELSESGNVDWTNGGIVPILASASTVELPDIGSEFYVSGTTGVTHFWTKSQIALNQKIRFVEITNQGSGYNPASPPSVTFSGGGGSGAAGTALVGNSGKIIGVEITNRGSGYTSAPTVAFGSGVAAGTVRVGCINFTGRKITLHFLDQLTVTEGADLLMAGNFTGGAGGGSMLTLRGAFGNFYEVSRSVNS